MGCQSKGVYIYVYVWHPKASHTTQWLLEMHLEDPITEAAKQTLTMQEKLACFIPEISETWLFLETNHVFL